MNSDYRSIRSFLRAIRRRDWMAKATVSMLRLAVVAVAVLSLDILLVERFPDRPWLGFAVALAGTMAFWVALVASVLWTRPLTLRKAGRLVEARRGELRDDVVTSLSLFPRLERQAPDESLSRPLLLALLATTAGRLKTLRPGHFVSWRPAGNWALRLVLVALPLAAGVQWGFPLSAASLRALVDPTVFWPPGKVAFEVMPGSTKIARGSSLRVEAKVLGPRPGAVILVTEGEGREEERYLMERAEGDSFLQIFPAVRDPFRYRLTSSAASSPWFSVEVVEAPTAGNFSVSYTWPAYTGLPPRITAGSGSLEALRGTSVRLEFSVNKALAEGRVYLGGNQYGAEEVAPARYAASLYLSGETSYRLELRDSEGFRNTDRLEFPIRYLEDLPPTVEIIEPRGEVSLGPYVQIPVLFRAADDFGILRVSLLTRDSSGRELRTPIVTGQPGTLVEREHLWDAAGIEAPPGSLVPVFLEAADNDTISGPKVALSNSFTLRIPDPDEEHRKTEETMEELVDDMTDLLADSLDLLGRYEEQGEDARRQWEEFSWEDFTDSENLRQSMREAADKMADTLSSLQSQMSLDGRTRPESLFQLGMISRQFDELRKMTVAPMEQVARSIDPADVRPEEFLQKNSFLEKYADETVEAMEQMTLQAEELQKEQNMADVKGYGRDMMDLQEEIINRLERLDEGDRESIEEILKELEGIEDILRDMMEALSRESRELPEEFLNSDALEDLPLTDIMKGLQEIRDLLRKGDIEGAKRAAQELLKSLGELLNRLQQAGEDFREESGRAMERLKSSTVPALDKLIEDQQRLLEQTEELDGELQARLRNESRDHPPTPESLMTEGERAQTDTLAEKEGEVGERTAGLAEEAAALKAALPFLDPSIESDLREAKAGMKSAEGKLAARMPGGAVPDERSALARLVMARDRARRSLQSLEQMEQMRAGRGGPPMLFGGRGAGAPRSTPSASAHGGGRLGTDVRSFRIPGKEDYEAPPLFRQEILKSLEEGYPEHYEEKIRDYFHRIAE